MVEEFDAFCFAGHKPGDTGIVYGESGSYAGYHVMYYVGEGERYDRYIAGSELRAEASEEWETTEVEKYVADIGYSLRFVK